MRSRRAARDAVVRRRRCAPARAPAGRRPGSCARGGAGRGRRRTRIARRVPRRPVAEARAHARDHVGGLRRRPHAKKIASFGTSDCARGARARRAASKRGHRLGRARERQPEAVAVVDGARRRTSSRSVAGSSFGALERGEELALRALRLRAGRSAARSTTSASRSSSVSRSRERPRRRRRSTESQPARGAERRAERVDRLGERERVALARAALHQLGGEATPAPPTRAAACSRRGGTSRRAPRAAGA